MPRSTSTGIPHDCSQAPAPPAGYALCTSIPDPGSFATLEKKKRHLATARASRFFRLLQPPSRMRFAPPSMLPRPLKTSLRGARAANDLQPSSRPSLYQGHVGASQATVSSDQGLSILPGEYARPRVRISSMHEYWCVLRCQAFRERER